MMLDAILYRSVAKIDERGEAEKIMVKLAQMRNSRAGITGILHREEDIFYHWMEGPSDAVNLLFTAIEKDRRHHKLTVLMRAPQSSRRFENWALCHSAKYSASLFDWAVEKQISILSAKPFEILGFLEHCAKMSDENQRRSRL